VAVADVILNADKETGSFIKGERYLFSLIFFNKGV